jgi:hypothetical protein
VFISAVLCAGGGWCQLPIDIVPHYGMHKRQITLHCYDKEAADPSSFL